ncbi:hypothetical protein ABH922_004676 [Rhodococcus sp. 27YEA15]|uniref:hypothetical protein n=1 Tax=Rhodococcus sp. 27YEA15 TaxID=3156259 RepID=UPI003C79B22A
MTDLMEIGPAPTMGRELVVIVVNVAVLLVVFAIIGSTLVSWILAGALTLLCVVRFVIGLRRWNRPEAPR